VSAAIYLGITPQDAAGVSLHVLILIITIIRTLQNPVASNTNVTSLVAASARV
jgi:hypothetical protein